MIAQQQKADKRLPSWINICITIVIQLVQQSMPSVAAWVMQCSAWGAAISGCLGMFQQERKMYRGHGR